MEQAQRRGEAGRHAGAAVALLAAAVCAVATLAALKAILAGLFQEWNDIRLAPSAAMLEGYALYYADAEGPVLSFLYGPVSPFVYLPAVLLPTPTTAVAAGLVLTFALYMAGPSWMLWRESRGRIDLFAFGVAGLALAPFLVRALSGPAYWIHADGVALWFTSLACALLYRREARGETRTLALSALCCALAVGSKQVAIPVAIALPLWLALAESPRVAWRYATWLAGLAAALLVVLLATPQVALEPMLFNTIVLPSAHPWKGDGGASQLVRASGRLLAISWPALLVLLADLVTTRPRAGGASGWRAWLANNPRTLVAFVGLAFVPTSILGFVKVGADSNALAYSLYFWVAAALLALVAGARARADRPAGSARRANALLIALVGLAAGIAATRLADLPDLVSTLPLNPERTAYAHALAHPGETWFPSLPLVALMSTGEPHHVSYGVFDRDLAGYPVSKEHLDRYRPHGMERIALRNDGDYMRSRLRPLRRQSPRSDLPAWILMAAGDARAAEPDPRVLPRPRPGQSRK